MKSYRFKTIKQILIVISMTGVANTSLAKTATPASFFNETYLKMKIKDELTPGLEVKSITFQRSEGSNVDQFQAAAHKDLDTELRTRAQELGLPENMQNFLNQKMENFDSYGFLVRNCLLRKDDCGRDLFDIIVETKSGQGMNGIQYQCDTKLVIQEPRSRVFLKDIEGDIKLIIDNCKIINADVTKNHMLVSSGLEKPSLATLQRSGYSPENPLEVSLNRQVDFLVQVENFSFHQPAAVEQPTIYSETTVSEVAKPMEVQIVSPAILTEERIEPQYSEYSDNEIFEMMGGSTQPHLQRDTKNSAMYCEVSYGGIQYSCFYMQANSPEGLPCSCDYPEDVQGLTRL